MCLNIIKATYANLILFGEKVKTFYLKSRTRQGCVPLMKVLTEENNKGHLNWKLGSQIDNVGR